MVDGGFSDAQLLRRLFTHSTISVGQEKEVNWIQMWGGNCEKYSGRSQILFIRCYHFLNCMASALWNYSSMSYLSLFAPKCLSINVDGEICPSMYSIFIKRIQLHHSQSMQVKISMPPHREFERKINTGRPHRNSIRIYKYLLSIDYVPRIVLDADDTKSLLEPCPEYALMQSINKMLNKKCKNNDGSMSWVL